MNLKQYFEESKDDSPQRLAEAVGVRAATVYNWMSGKTVPNVCIAIAIERYTGGKVTCYDFGGGFV